MLKAQLMEARQRQTPEPSMGKRGKQLAAEVAAQRLYFQAVDEWSLEIDDD